MTTTLRVGAVQFEPRPLDVGYNLARVEHFARRAAAEGVRIVAFPEMCLLGYWHLTKRPAAELWAVAEPVDGPSVGRAAALASELGIGIGVGWLEAAGDRLFNSYAVCLPDGAVHVHRKLHAFEHEAISSGNAYTVFDTPWGVRVGVLICYDNNLVENPRATALLGAQIILAPHQTGGTASRSPRGMKVIDRALWDARATDPGPVEAAFAGRDGRGWLMRWLPARAHDNGVFYVFSNGVGIDDDEVRTGNAMVIDCYGEVVAETGVAADALVVADCDLSEIPLSSGRRWLAARRPELYDVLLARRGDERDPRTARFSTDPLT